MTNAGKLPDMNDNAPTLSQDDTGGLLKLLAVAASRYEREPETRHLSGWLIERTAAALNALATQEALR